MTCARRPRGRRPGPGRRRRLRAGLPHGFLGGAVDADGRPLYRVRVATLDGGPVRTAGGLLRAARPRRLRPRRRRTPSSSPASSAARDARRHASRRRWPTRSPRPAAHARMVSICTGAFVLAAAGLLDGRPATTHWLHADAFRALFPQVRLDPDVLFVDDGDVLTSAGTPPASTCCCTSSAATTAARWPTASPGAASSPRGATAASRSSSSGRSPSPATPARRPPAPGRSTGWPSRSTLADLAAHARMSVRTFTRRFREETGLSAARSGWSSSGVALARQLLETTDTPVEQVAADAGFGTDGLAAPAPARRDRRRPAGLPPHLPGTGRSPRCDRRLPGSHPLSRCLVEWWVPAPPSLIRSRRTRRRAEAAPPRRAGDRRP